MSTNTKLSKEEAKKLAVNIGIMVDALRQEGFGDEAAREFVCAMLSSAVVYTPFAAMSAPVDEDTMRRMN